MGISIHYSGKITNKQKLPQLIEEVQEIATVHGWKSKIYENEFPTIIDSLTPSETLNNAEHDGLLYGISFSPEGSEPVSICFLSNGKMSSMMQLACWGDFKTESEITIESEELDADGNWISSTDNMKLDEVEYNRMLYMCSTKTQYAGPNAHELIIGVLRYISITYLCDFKMTDEAQFWETGDIQALNDNFKRSGLLIQNFTVGLQSAERLPNEDLDSFIRRIARGMNTEE
jgi:hypothetical protein